MARMSRDEVARGTTSPVKTLNAVPTMTRMPRTRAARRRAVSTPSSCHAAPRRHRGGVRSPRRRGARNDGAVPDPSTDTVEGMDAAELVVADAAGWQDWLRRHHGQSPGVWLVLAKKGTGDPTALSYYQALDEAICFGWIDGQIGRRDSTTFRRRFTPRKPRSPWSQRNTVIAERLTAAGRMQPAGEAEIARAKGDGRWDAAYASQSTIDVPDDLEIALAAQPSALAMFEVLTSQNRYAVLYRIGNAKRAETRARRIEQFVAMLARGETVYPQARSLAD